MTDTAVIERRGKAHTEAAEEQAAADQEAAAKVVVPQDKPKKKILDDQGRQLTFEDVPVEELDNRIVGDFKVEEGLGYMRKGGLIRFEGYARLDEVTHKTRRKGKVSTEVRAQKFYVEHVEAWRDTPGLGKPAEIDRKLAEFAAEVDRVQREGK